MGHDQVNAAVRELVAEDDEALFSPRGHGVAGSRLGLPLRAVPCARGGGGGGRDDAVDGVAVDRGRGGEPGEADVRELAVAPAADAGRGAEQAPRGRHRRRHRRHGVQLREAHLADLHGDQRLLLVPHRRAVLPAAQPLRLARRHQGEQPRLRRPPAHRRVQVGGEQPGREQLDGDTGQPREQAGLVLLAERRQRVLRRRQLRAGRVGGRPHQDGHHVRRRPQRRRHEPQERAQRSQAELKRLVQVHAARRGGCARGEPAGAGDPLRPELRQRPGLPQLAAGEPQLRPEGGVRGALVQLLQRPGVVVGEPQRGVRPHRGQRVPPRALPARPGLAGLPQRVRRRQPRRERQRQPLLRLRRLRRRRPRPGLGALDAAGQLLPPRGRAGPRRGLRRARPGLVRATQRHRAPQGPGTAAPAQRARVRGGGAVLGAVPPGDGAVRGAAVADAAAGAGPVRRDGGVGVRAAGRAARAAGRPADVPPRRGRRTGRAPRDAVPRRRHVPLAPRVGLQAAHRDQRVVVFVRQRERDALPGRRGGRPERGHQPVPVPQRRQQLRPGEPVVQACRQHQERRPQKHAARAAAPQAPHHQDSLALIAAGSQ